LFLVDEPKVLCALPCLRGQDREGPRARPAARTGEERDARDEAVLAEASLSIWPGSRELMVGPGGVVVCGTEGSR